MPGRDVRDEHDRELPIRALQRRRAEASLEARDVVDSHRARGRRNSQPANLLDIAALALEDANLDWVLLLTFLEVGDLIVARHRQAKRVANRRHAHAEIGRPLPIDGDMDFGVRDVERDIVSVMLLTSCAATSARFE